jgi:hypothetical protein
MVRLAVVVLLVSGCGSSSGSGRLSHTDLVKRADAICAEAHQAQQAVPAPKTLADVAPVLDRELPIVRAELRKLAALQPAQEDEAAFKALLSDFSKSIALGVQVRNAARAGARTRQQLLTPAAAGAITQTRAVATGLGLRVCSQAAG